MNKKLLLTAVILAFSMGGSIAWEAGLKGMDIGRLYAVSSTRLRLQTEKPACQLQLFYGSDDPFQPDASWFETLKLDPKNPREVMVDETGNEQGDPHGRE